MKSHSKPRETTSARGACSADSDLQKWAAAAIESELGELATMTKHNICKPASPMWVSLLKIASIIKGSHISQLETFISIENVCKRHNWLKVRDLEYQWQRALKTAVPRHPEVICNYDIKNGRAHSPRLIPLATIEKAEQLAAALSEMLETGVKPEIPNLNVDFLEQDKNGITVNLIFLRWSQALADCVQTAVSRLDSFIWSDYHNGIFKIWLRTNRL